MPSEITTTPVPIKIWSELHDVESQALDQLKQVASLPWVYHHVAAMADCHLGKGCTVGSVIAMKDALAPAAVGVDIGCGMGALRTNLTADDLPDSLEAVRSAIEAVVPVGFNWHEHTLPLVNTYSRFWSRFRDIKAPLSTRVLQKAKQQCGTLGGGNHFIEICLDTNKQVWIMLHSGSRNVGNEIAQYHINVAKELVHNERIPDKDMAVFLAKTKEMEAYRHDLYWAQEYALLNRKTMMEVVKTTLTKLFPRIEFFDNEAIHVHHNYVSEEIHYGENVFVTRKGAIKAERGDMGIIPGSMGAKSYIVRGLGNPESFNSASHGAGRKMSRGAAKRHFTMEDLAKQTEGVCCRKDSGVIDEIPGAYKDIDVVMANQKDLVEIVYELKQVLCIKG